MCYYFSATEAANLSTDTEKKEHIRIKKSLRQTANDFLVNIADNVAYLQQFMNMNINNKQFCYIVL